MRVAVIGAGPSGLSCAYTLLKNNIEVHIYESKNSVGGLSTSIDLWNQKVELGPHFLSAELDKEVQEMLDDLLPKDEFYTYNRLTRILLDNSFITYPPTPLSIVKNTGVINSSGAFFKLLSHSVREGTADESTTFDGYIQSRLGHKIYNTFFKGYTEKLWGIPCNTISAEYAKTLIGFGDIDLNSIFKKIAGISKKKKHKVYLYPKKGMSNLWEQLQHKIVSLGGQFIFSAKIKSIDICNKEIVKLSNENCTQTYDYIISTIPESKLLSIISEDTPCNVVSAVQGLSFRNVMLLYMQFRDTDFIEENNLYIYNDTIKCVRITNYNRFKKAKGKGIIMMEYWVDNNEPMWHASAGDVMKIAEKDFLLLFNRKLSCLNWDLVKLPRAFPVPGVKSEASKKVISNHLKQYTRLIRLGRSNQNNFNYGMEDALKDGVDVAERLKKGTLL